jgi:hypothetical protein
LEGSIPRHLSPFAAGKLAGMKKEELEQCERDWIAAEAELDAARKLPGGPERTEALRRAGRLRYEADERRHAILHEIEKATAGKGG